MDSKFLRDLMDRYGNKVYRLALRSTGSRHLAEDITQETFLRACAHLDRYDHHRPPGPWLFRIALNLCRNQARKAWEIPLDWAAGEPAAYEAGPEQLYLEKERNQELLRALYRLPEMYREVLLLKHVSELSYAEIGAALDLELSLVKNRLYRGRLALRAALTAGRED
ncbi:MAG: sigma-70 family RNA polymerase sigma factor [Bacillota bacterium]